MKRFRDLTVGQWFDFIGPTPGYNSFFKRCKKIGSRKYIDSDGVEHRVGSINATVYHVSNVKSNPRRRRSNPCLPCALALVNPGKKRSRRFAKRVLRDAKWLNKRGYTLSHSLESMLAKYGRNRKVRKAAKLKLKTIRNPRLRGKDIKKLRSAMSRFQSRVNPISSREFGMGGIQRYEKGDASLTLSKRYGAYIVQGFVRGRHVNESYRTLTQARKAMSKLKK